MTQSEEKTLPVVSVDAEFGGGTGTVNFIQGDRMKFTDGRWANGDGIDIDVNVVLIAMGTARANRLLQDGRFVETIVARTDQELADVSTLNAEIPQDGWPISEITGEPQPPWSRWAAVYLLDAGSGQLWTFANSTIGARICIERLESKVVWMRKLRGERVCPLVKPDSRPMKTRFGRKMRPELGIVDWRDLGGGGKPAIDPPSQPQLPGRVVAEPSLREELNDEIPI
jgi:hypothetical protein